MSETIAPTTRRELSKADRRLRIVAAATSLLREKGVDGVSMLQIAERADVSPATVYNLFQTKAGVLQQVFDRDLRDYERLVEAAPARDALDRIFEAVDIAAGLYQADPGFYRAMAQVHRGPGPHPAIGEPRIGFWRRMAAAARAEGRLAPEADPHILGVTLSQILRGAFFEWAGGGLSAERLAAEASYGFALVLLAHATGDAAAGLTQRVRRLEAALAGPRPDGCD